MPDPLTIVTGTLAIVGHAIQGVQAISGYVNKYNLADLTIASMMMECSAIRMALLQIQRLIVDKTLLSTQAGDDHAKYILEDFEGVLSACSLTFAVLSQHCCAQQTGMYMHRLEAIVLFYLPRCSE
jgi:hypothetical protein